MKINTNVNTFTIVIHTLTKIMTCNYITPEKGREGEEKKKEEEKSEEIYFQNLNVHTHLQYIS